jgi:hypothetical protein
MRTEGRIFRSEIGRFFAMRLQPPRELILKFSYGLFRSEFSQARYLALASEGILSLV